MATAWSKTHKGRVRRRAYARLLFHVVAHGDFASVPFLLKRSIFGGR